MVTVVYLVASPVVEEAQGTRGTVVMVFEGGRCHAACDARVVVDVRSCNCTGVGGIEVSSVQVAPHFPVVAEVVAQFDVAAILLKFHVGTVPVTSVIRAGSDASEPSVLHAVGSLGL